MYLRNKDMCTLFVHMVRKHRGKARKSIPTACE